MTAAGTVRYGCVKLDPPYGQTIYAHPNGYVIVKERRTIIQPGVEWWTVYFHAASSRASSRSFWPWARQRMAIHADTLREAAKWCAANPRSGWEAA